jgi:hypothetical protein
MARAIKMMANRGIARFVVAGASQEVKVGELTLKILASGLGAVRGGAPALQEIPQQQFRFPKQCWSLLSTLQS